MQWNVHSKIIPKNFDELEEILLSNRKITDKEHFFHPPSPLEVALEESGINPEAMKKALLRLEKAKENHEDVLIFGDYDADGICATGILWEGLKAFGITARPFIPERIKHGYGLSMRSLAAVLAEKKPDVLITVDNGIVAHDAFAELQKMGVFTILTDHHQPEAKLPTADIILHTPKVSGAGVAWFFARELSREAAEKSLDLAAIATVADQMPMLELNRALVTHGLIALRKTHRVGLQVLLARAGIESANIDTGTINYALAPRINAMGRIKHGLAALRLICTTNMARADELVNELQSTNTSRQEMTVTMVEHAMVSSKVWIDEHIIIVSSSEYHEGVIGLLAGKLMEKFHKPAIAISIGSTVAKASARSVPGVNIIDLIRMVKDDLLEAGGHPMAAGFGVLPEKIELVGTRLRTLAKEHISKELLQPSIDVECLLPFEMLNLQTYERLQKFAPFGNGNPEPVFGIQNARVLSAQTMGREDRHLKMLVQNAEADLLDADTRQKLTRPVTAIGWSMGEQVANLIENPIISLACNLQINEWKGKRSVQVLVRDLQISVK